MKSKIYAIAKSEEELMNSIRKGVFSFKSDTLSGLRKKRTYLGSLVKGRANYFSITIERVYCNKRGRRSNGIFSK